MSAPHAWAVVLGLVMGFGLWSVASIIPGLSRPRLAKRIAPYLQDVSDGAREFVAPTPPGPLPVLAVLAAPVFDWGRRFLSMLLGGSGEVARGLRQSGSTASVEAFRSQQLLVGLAGGALGIGVVALTGVSPFPVGLVVVGLGAALGVLGREWMLRRAALARLARLRAELPVVLEFLTLSLSAGEGILDAIRRVSAVGSGELAREFATVTTRVATGLPVADTLRALANELDLPAFTRVIDQMVGALERGSPLAEVLRAQAQDARDETKRELLEIAGTKEIAMMVPLVFFILPVTVCFAIFPGIVVLQLGL